jgi:hypothetical protein
LFITLEIGVPSSRDGGAKKNEERDKKAEVTLRMQIGVKRYTIIIFFMEPTIE